MKKVKRGGNTITRLYGYRIKNKIFTIKEDVSKVVSFIFDSYLEGVGYKTDGNVTWCKKHSKCII